MLSATFGIMLAGAGALAGTAAVEAALWRTVGRIRLALARRRLRAARRAREGAA